MKSKLNQSGSLIQLLVTFVIPIVILSYFSSESQLGPTKGFLVALAFPVVYEVYGIYKHRKPNIISLLAIGGILVTGAISLFKLNEDWLAVRRALPYVAVAVAIIISDLIKRPVFQILLPRVLDMDKVTKHAIKLKTLPKIQRTIKLAGILTSLLLILVAIIIFILTKVIIISATDTPAFNHEYAKLRLISIPVTTLPLVIGVTIILYYLVTEIEKLTKLNYEEILKKRSK